MGIRARRREIAMLQIKRVAMNILIAIALAMICFMCFICFAHSVTEGIKFTLNGTDVEFDELTYGDLKQFDLQYNSVFIVTDGEEQMDITSCNCESSDIIRSLTVVITNAESVCDFSVYGIKIGDSGDIVISNMPKETSHIIDSDTDVRMSKYSDKNNNVLIVGTDVELNLVSYITIRRSN